MHPRHEEAKHLFQSKQYQEAKQVLLDIIRTNKRNSNSTYLTKLGDIFCETGEFNNAQKYYQQALNENPQNPSVLLKLGNILCKHLNDSKHGISLYEKCLQISPSFNECVFEYAKVMEHENNYSKAKELYTKCLEIDNTKASLHYRYAKLLIKYQKANNYNLSCDSKIDFLLNKAIELQPNVCEYRRQYAHFLEHKLQINKANEQWQETMHLCNYSDMILLYEFANFNLQYKNDTNEALKYYRIASDIQSNLPNDTKINYSYITNKYLQLKQSINTNEENEENEEKYENNNNDNNIKLIIYEFDEIITYWNIPLDDEFDKIPGYDLYKIFGGYDRINRLYIHFENVLKPMNYQTPQFEDENNNNNRVKIALISRNNSTTVIQALKRVKLYQFFENSLIIGSDNCEYFYKRRSKYDDIINIKDQHKIFNKSVLLIDNVSCMDPEMIQQLSSQCILFRTEYTNNNKILRGLTFNDFDHIECIINQKQYVPYKLNINQSLKHINSELYTGLKREIRSMDINDQIQSLPAIKWVNTNLHSNSKDFIAFAVCFRKIVLFMSSEDIWSAAQKLSELILIETNDAYLCCKYAKCLSYLRHIKQADYYYNKSISDGYLEGLIGYGYHLLSLRYWYKANVQFEKYLRLRHRSKPHCKLFVGLARSASHLDKPDISEEWYLRAIESEQNWIGFYHQAHLHYAAHLHYHGRFNEAIQHLSLCIDHNPCQALTHYKMAQIFHKMGELQSYEKHLAKALEIDPYLTRARDSHMRYYNEGYYEDVFYAHIDCDNMQQNQQTDTVTRGGGVDMEYKEDEKEYKLDKYEDEFNRFWFEGLQMVDKNSGYRIYYEKMIEYEMNDIRCLLFGQDIDDIIRNKVGVKIDDDVQIIVNKIMFYRNENNKFIQWLKQWELYEMFYPIFETNAIYTMESFKRNVNQKQELGKMVELYHNNSVHKYNEIINRLWIAKRNFHRQI